MVWIKWIASGLLGWKWIGPTPSKPGVGNNEGAVRFVTHDKSTTYETLLKQLNLLSSLKELFKWPAVASKLSMSVKSLDE